MASVRQRDGRWTALYRDREGHQRSAGTYGTKSVALKAARASEAIEAAGADARQVLRAPEMLYSSEKKGKPTVAGYAPQWLSGHRLEPTSRATYACMLLHIVRELGDVTLADLDAPRVRTFIRGLEATRLSSRPRRPSHDDAPHDARDRSRRPADGSRPHLGHQGRGPARAGDADSLPI